ncbi:MAG TPA: ABC transporter ATP-binding protein [Trueperaceae bacterium]|nr:ABC transporter ATP-binding protein [Trueperaceae bacterium]
MTLVCREIYRSFKSGNEIIEILKGVNLELIKAEIIAILGPSGSGKTTLLNLLAGLDKPSKGEIYWGDIAVHAKNNNELAKLRLKELGLVFQSHYLLEDLTVFENVNLTGRLQGNIDKARTLEVLQAVGLENRKDYLPKKLSGGERQRVAVARAIYAKPKIILADEPTGSLDRQSAKAVYELLVELARHEGSSVIMVTHDEALVKDLDKRYRLDDGKLIID